MGLKKGHWGSRPLMKFLGWFLHFCFSHLKLQSNPPKPECCLKYQPDNPLISLLVVDNGGTGRGGCGCDENLENFFILVAGWQRKQGSGVTSSKYNFLSHRGGTNWEIPNESKWRLQDAPEICISKAKHLGELFYCKNCCWDKKLRFS